MVGAERTGWLDRHPVISYVLVAFGISWGLGVIAFDDRLAFSAPTRTIADHLAKFGPSLAALVVVGLTGGVSGVRGLLGGLLHWRVSGRWYAVALLGPLFLWSVAAAIRFGLRGEAPSTDRAAWALFLPLVSKHVFAGGGLGEEIGWRGYLLPRLQSRRSALTSSLVIGLLWGCCHVPAFLYAGAGKSGGLETLVLFTLLTTALAVVFTSVYNSTRGSLLIVVLLHGAFNGSENWIKRLLPDLAGDATSTILFGILVLTAALVLLLVFGGRSLSSNPVQTESV
jgi:membrane protease YdiL (CAAX protease family)